MRSLDLVVVGHCARDEFADGTWRLGGSALYGAATASRLGARVAMVTRVGPRERDALERTCRELGVALHVLPSNVTTTFAHIFDVEGKRTLVLRARARGIAAGDLPGEAREAGATLLGSVAQELAEDLLAGLAPTTVLIGQGLLREWDANGTVHAATWSRSDDLLRGLSAVVISDEDVRGQDKLPARWSMVAPVALTLGERGAEVWSEGVATHVPGFPVRTVIDQTGAGDAFAAGMAVALAEGRGLTDAARFANAVASFAVEGPGIEPLATRDAVERRLAG